MNYSRTVRHIKTRQAWYMAESMQQNQASMIIRWNRSIQITPKLMLRRLRLSLWSRRHCPPPQKVTWWARTGLIFLNPGRLSWKFGRFLHSVTSRTLEICWSRTRAGRELIAYDSVPYEDIIIWLDHRWISHRFDRCHQFATSALASCKYALIVVVHDEYAYACVVQ